MSKEGAPSSNRVATRPPFRYQPTNPPSSLTAPPREKRSTTPTSSFDDISLDEKSSPVQSGPSASHSHQTHPSEQQRMSPNGRGRGHVRTTSRDDAHWQSRASAEARSRSSASDALQASLTIPSPGRPLRPYVHRFHSHPPTPTYHAHRQQDPSPGETSACCGINMSPKVKAWIPLGAWIATSLGFLIAIGWYKDEVFMGLELLSDWIRHEGYTGQAILFFLIFLTTFPPMPLYSTLIVLSGYCLGAYYGAVLSYFAALFGAIAVFLLSRTYLRSYLAEMIHNCPTSIKRAIRAVEKQPKLLFLIRLSPYPYNLMNALLATSRISFSTYTWCTALSLFKVIIHTSIGAGIHKFSDYHTHSHDATNDGDGTESGNSEGDGEDWSKIYTIFGVVLCIVVLVYLGWVARRAVDDLDDDEDGALPASRSDEESMAFLSPMAQDDSRRPSFDYARLGGAGEVMLESPLRPSVALPRPTSPSYRS